MKKAFVVLILTLGLLGAPTRTASQTGEDKNAAKLPQLLEQSGYAYTKAGERVWTVPFRGKAIPEFNVIAIYQDGLVVLVTIVAEKEDYRPAPELMQKLLRLNDEMDRVKIGVDEDGAVMVRVDLSARVLDAAELKLNAEHVAAATEQVYLAVKPFLAPPKSPKK